MVQTLSTLFVLSSWFRCIVCNGHLVGFTTNKLRMHFFELRLETNFWFIHKLYKEYLENKTKARRKYYAINEKTADGLAV